MEAYGVSSWVYWMGNLVVELAKLFFITVPTALVWTYTAVFQSTSIDVQLLLITLFFASSLALCLLIASFATRREHMSQPSSLSPTCRIFRIYFTATAALFCGSFTITALREYITSVH
ncbi:hypothetical protein V5799_014014 [Amblyomma americanum]|uniref:Uncharacterized protein n=1 Tax=Amblyomma americanum TaxID=6943 RepID=A0AAQ4E4G8_AMBAM